MYQIKGKTFKFFLKKKKNVWGVYLGSNPPPKPPKKLFFPKKRLAAIFMTQKSFSGTFYKQEDFLSILVPKMSKSDKNQAYYNFLSLLFYFFIFQQNLQSVQKCIQIKENEKNYCDFNFYSILINFVSN